MTAHVFPNQARAKQWREALLCLLALFLGVSFVYRETLVGMVEIWIRSDTFTHCFLVFPISLWLIWQKRHELAAVESKPSYWLLVPVVVFSILWILGSVTTTNSIEQLAYVLLIQALVIGTIGVSAARVIAFPIGFLIFMLPVGEFLLPTLMEWTANFTVFALRLTGIPVYRDGLQFVIPSGNWSVVEACSGVRYLMASVTVGALFAYINYSSNKRRLIFIGFSLIVPIFANWLRAYLIVLVGHLSKNTIAVGFDHIVYGWLFFGIVVVVMFMVGVRWAEPVKPARSQEVTTVAAPVQSIKNYSSLVFFVACMGVIFSSALMVARINGQASGGAVSLQLPEALSEGWVISKDSPEIFRPQFKSPTAEINTTYKGQSGSVGIYIAYYNRQASGRKLISSENFIIGSEDRKWVRVGQGGERFATSDGSIDLRATALKRVNDIANLADSSLSVWQYYWINGHVTSSDYIGKIYGAMSKILGNGDDSAVVVIYALGDASGASTVMQSFLKDNYGRIDKILRDARGASGESVLKNSEVNKG